MMHTRSRRSFLATVALGAFGALVLAGCDMPMINTAEARSNKTRLPANAPEADLQALVAGQTAFALDLYAQLRQNAGNIFFSPYSIAQAVAMTLLGARGQTATQMRAALHATQDDAAWYGASNTLDQRLTSPRDTANFTLSVVNRLWGQRGYAFAPAFLDQLAQYYGAGLFELDFVQSPEPARATINKAIEQQTNGMIRDLLTQGTITDLTRLVITNAVYFKAKWVDPFKKEATHDQAFTLADGSDVQVPTMSSRRMIDYSAGDDYQAIALPYKGAASMLAILPAEGKFDQFEAHFDAVRLTNIVGALATREVELTMPKFDYTSDAISLRDMLKRLGIEDAFDPAAADFSGMDGKRTFFLSEAIHKAAVKIDEEGTEAAAATAMIMTAGSAAPQESVQVYLNRPFLIAIRDDATGAVLFLGRIADPRGA